MSKKVEKEKHIHAPPKSDEKNEQVYDSPKVLLKPLYFLLPAIGALLVIKFGLDLF